MPFLRNRRSLRSNPPRYVRRGGERSARALIDGGDDAPWTSIQRDYEDGVVYREELTTDDGTIRRHETNATDPYHGRVERTSYIDAGDNHDWAVRSVNERPHGFQFERLTNDDGTTVLTEYLENGRTVEQHDPEDTHPWEEIFTVYRFGEKEFSEITYDADAPYRFQFNAYESPHNPFEPSGTHPGRIASRSFYPEGRGFDDPVLTINYEYEGDFLAVLRTDHPNGIESMTWYENGVIDSKRIDDTADIHTWTEQHEYYDNGLLLQRSFENDDGTAKFMHYDIAGDTSTLLRIEQYDRGNVHAWDQIVEWFDDTGERTSRGVEYDDGRFSNTRFENGERDYSRSEDYENAYDWAKIHTSYVDGVKAVVSYEWDDGLLIETGFDPDGTIRFRAMLDRGDTRSWSEISDQYEGGIHVNRTTTYDDGVERLAQHENGALATVERLDALDAHDWTEQRMTYEDGTIALRETVYDSGRESAVHYDETGTLTLSTNTDAADAFLWASTVAQYENGALKTHTAIQDDGVQRRAHYDADGLYLVEKTDPEDARDWTSITEHWDGGVLVSSDTVWDDDRVM